MTAVPPKIWATPHAGVADFTNGPEGLTAAFNRALSWAERAAGVASMLAADPLARRRCQRSGPSALFAVIDSDPAGTARAATGPRGATWPAGEGRMMDVLASRDGMELTVGAEVPPGMRPAAGSEPLILLVDDDDLVRPVIGDALRDAGYRVVEASSAEVALALVPELGRIDLLVSDVVMPGMDGPAMVAQMRDLRSDLNVMFITGHAGQHSLDGERVLQKPFTNRQLMAHVVACIG